MVIHAKVSQCGDPNHPHSLFPMSSGWGVLQEKGFYYAFDWPKLNGIGTWGCTPLALASQELNSIFLFPIHFLFCCFFVLFCYSLFLLYLLIHLHIFRNPLKLVPLPEVVKCLLVAKESHHKKKFHWDNDPQSCSGGRKKRRFFLFPLHWAGRLYMSAAVYEQQQWTGIYV